jgi:prepilin-type N-terminal cleavage/methylation domain-containing protein
MKTLQQLKQKGFNLIEILIALLLFSVLVTAFMSALATTTKVSALVDRNQAAKNLAEIVLQKVNELPYDPTVVAGTALYYYDGPAQTDNPIAPLIPSDYAAKQFTASIIIGYPHDPNRKIQEITVVVMQNNSEVRRLEGYKTN